MTLLSVSKSAIEVGTIIDAVGPPNSSWKICDGSILAQADYTKYVSRAFDLHPHCWGSYEIIDKPSFALANVTGSICKKGNTIIAMPFNEQDIFYSTDNGANWQETNTNVLPSAGLWGKVTTNGTIFVALKNSSNAGAYSSDGLTWTGFTLPATGTWDWLAWNGSIFLTIDTISNSPLYYSSDGYNWYAGATFGTGVYCNTLCKGNDASGYFLFYGSDYKIRKTNNGTSITTGDVYYFNESQSNPQKFLYLNNAWWAYMDNSYPYFTVSTDGGSTWKTRPHVNQDQYDEYPYFGAGSFYSGEEYVFLDEWSYNSWTSKDGYYFTSKLNPVYEIFDTIFISKSVGAVILCRSDLTTDPCRVARLKYTPYDYNTYFQLPKLFSRISGMDKYIKVR